MGFLSEFTKLAFGNLKDRRNGFEGGPEIRNGVVIEPPEPPESSKLESGRKEESTRERPSAMSARHGTSGNATDQASQEESGKRKGSEDSESPLEEGFLNWLLAGGRAERTIREYGYEIRWWRARAKRRSKDIMELSAPEIEASLRRVKTHSYLRKVAALKTWSRWKLREGDGRLFMELEKVQKPRVRKRLPKDLGPESFRKLRDQAKKMAGEGRREGIWIGLMLLGGLRISEIATCRPYQDGVKVIGKGSRERYVPIPVWLLEAMRRMNKKGRGGWGVSRQKIGSVLSRTQGIRNPHRLRHTYASELIRRGYRIEQVQKLLGHEDIKTTTVYARVEVPPDVCDRLGM